MSKKSAFTLLEVSFVLAILGIIMTMGSEIILVIYQGYFLQKSLYTMQNHTALASTQIANRLAYSIKGTVIARKDEYHFKALKNITGEKYPILEWMGYDREGFTFLGTKDRRPAWSGYCDLNASSLNILFSPGSKFTELENIHQHLSTHYKGVSDEAIIFTQHPNIAHEIAYRENKRSNRHIHPIENIINDHSLRLKNKHTRTMKEHYQITRTAYALVPENIRTHLGKKVFDLVLYYNYQPWKDEYYTQGKHQILIPNISLFIFKASGDTLQFKLCQKASSTTIQSCKEKTILR